MKNSELKRLLKKMGCRFETHGGRHDNWINLKTGKIFQVPRHDGQEIKTGTLEAIMKQARLK